MSPIVTVAAKDLKILFRDRFALFWIFAFPLMYALFFGALFGDGGDRERSRIPIAIVDEDQSDESAVLVERLASHGSLQVDRDGDSVMRRSFEEARDDVQKGRKVAYLRIPPGYGEAPFRMFGGGGDGPGLEVGLDPSRTAEAGFLQGILMEAVFGGMFERFTDKQEMDRVIADAREDIRSAEDLGAGQKLVLESLMGALSKFVDEADPELLAGGPGGMASGDRIQVVEVTRERGNEPRSAFEITFPAAMIWGLMGVAIGFAITLVRERTQGTMLRLTVAPIGRARLLLGKALGCFAMCMFVMACLLVFGYLALGVRVGSPLLAGIAMACTAACFTGLMMTAAVIGKTEQAVAGASWGLMMPFAMIGGGMIPLIAMPPWLSALSDYSPFKWGIYAMEGAVWRGFTPADMLAPCAILLAMGLVFFGLGVTVFNRR